MVKLSKGNTKMGKVWNVSLSPIVSCPAGVPCAKGCYALKAYRMYKNTKIAWDHNLEMSKGSDFFTSITNQLESARKLPKFFRWHVAGDIQNEEYFTGMINLAVKFPTVKFLAFTKNYSAVNSVLDFYQYPSIDALPENFQVVFSAWPNHSMDNPYNFPIAFMDDGNETRLTGNEIECPGNCESCGMCFSLSTIKRNVVFLAH